MPQICETKRSDLLSLRLRTWERSAIELAAADAHETISEFVRRVVLDEADRRVTVQANDTR